MLGVSVIHIARFPEWLSTEIGYNSNFLPLVLEVYLQ